MIRRVLRKLLLPWLADPPFQVPAKPAVRAVIASGQTQLDELEALAAMAREVPDGQVIVELGSYLGRSSIALGAGSEAGAGVRVYAIDPHTHFTGPKGGAYGPQDQAQIYRNLSKAQIGHIVAVISLPSQDVCKFWTQSNVGLLFIDGDHNYEPAKADFLGWYDHVLPGGVIAFHDVNDTDVKRLLGEVEASHGIQRLGGVRDLAWYRKPEG